MAGLLQTPIRLFIVAWLAQQSLSHHPHDEVDSFSATADLQSVVAIMRSTVYLSQDFGSSWTRLTYGVPDAEARAVAISPTGNRLWMITRQTNHLYLAEQLGGFVWQRPSRMTGEVDEETIARAREFMVCGRCNTNSPHVFGNLGTGIVRSNDQTGRSWDKVLSKERVTAMACFCQHELIAAGTSDGKVFLSDDMGDSWERITDTGVPDVTALTFENRRRIHIGTRDGQFYTYNLLKGRRNRRQSLLGGAVSSITMSSGSLIAVTANNATFTSTNRGRSWEQYGLFPPAKQAITAAVPIFRYLVAARNSAMVLMAGHSGVFRSDDSGRTWYKVDALASGLITGIDVSSPVNGNSYTLVLATLAAGVVKAEVQNGMIGKWEVHTTGMANHTRLQSIRIAPTYNEDSRMYIGGGNNKIFVMDDGLSWSRRWYSNELLPNRYCGSWTFSPKFLDDETLWVKCSKTPAQFPQDVPGTILFQSSDGGATFFPSATSESIAGPLVTNSDGMFFWPKGEGQGLARSSDNGETWETIGGFDGYGTVAAVDDGPLFYGDNTGLYISRDDGNTWRRLRRDSVRFSAVARDVLAVSPNFNNDREILVQEEGGDLYKCKVGTGSNLACMQSRITSQDGYPIMFGLMSGFGKDQSVKIIYSPLYATDNTVIGSSADRLYLSSNGGIDWKQQSMLIRYDTGPNHDESQQFDFTGQWYEVNDPGHSMSSAMESQEVGATTQLHITGYKVDIITVRSPDAGTIGIYIDGQYRDSVELSGNYRQQWKAASYRLPDAAHTVEIRVERAGFAGVVIDAIDVTRF